MRRVNVRLAVSASRKNTRSECDAADGKRLKPHGSGIGILKLPEDGASKANNATHSLTVVSTSTEYTAIGMDERRLKPM